MQTSQLAENDNFADIFGLQALVLVTADDKQLVLSSCLEQMTPHWDGTRQLGGADDADDNEVADDADADNNDNEDADDSSADTDDWSPVLMMPILMTMLMLLMA